MDRMIVHCKVTHQHFKGLPGKFTRTHLYSWVKRGTVRVNCLVQEHVTLMQPGFEPGPLNPESSALTLDYYISCIHDTKWYDKMYNVHALYKKFSLRGTPFFLASFLWLTCAFPIKWRILFIPIARNLGTLFIYYLLKKLIFNSFHHKYT